MKVIKGMITVFSKWVKELLDNNDVPIAAVISTKNNGSDFIYLYKDSELVRKLIGQFSCRDCFYKPCPNRTNWPEIIG